MPLQSHVDDADNFGPIQDAAAAGVDALKALAQQLALDIGDELHAHAIPRRARGGEGSGLTTASIAGGSCALRHAANWRSLSP